MKTKTITTQHKARGAVLPSLALLGTLLMAPLANAATVALPFTDDFESGLDTTTVWTKDENVLNGGFNLVGVTHNNGSDMAHLQQFGDEFVSLSIDTTYYAAAPVSFRMEANADTVIPNTNPINSDPVSEPTLYSASGVNIIFLDSLSNEVGTYTITNDTFPVVGPPPANVLYVGSSPQNYGNTMGGFATLAGINPADPAIVKFQLEFFALAQSDPANNSRRSSSSVFFDDVKVVPVPASIWLLGSGLLGLIGVARRKKA